MKVCYFGIYKSEYSRNKLFILGLKKNGVAVEECRSDKTGISKYFDLIKKHRSLKGDYDIMMVGYPGFQAVILAKFLTKKPIVFNAFVSLYDSMVQDRKKSSRFSLRALYYWILDKLSLSFSDVAIFDTNEHIKYVSSTFGINNKKLKRIFVGADTTVFYPRENKLDENIFRVVFYGHYIPLQGVEHIIQAAKILQPNDNIRFEIIGDGPGKDKIITRKNLFQLNNVSFGREMPLYQLAERIAAANVCLGIFGDTDKAKRVIPNKVYQYVAMRKPVITADTLAIRELFTEEELFLVEISNPQKIAEAILSVQANPQTAALNALRAYNKFTNHVLSEQLGAELKKIIYEL